MNVGNNQQGVTSTTIIGVVLILVVVSFAGWRVIEGNKSIDNNVTNQSANNDSKNDKEESKSTAPDGYATYSKGKHSFYYPENQQPAKDVTDNEQKQNEKATLGVELKDYEITIYETVGLEYNRGIVVPIICSYDVNDSLFTFNKAKSYHDVADTACKAINKKSKFNSIVFNDVSTGYESLIKYGYAAPTKDKKYFVQITNTRNDQDCYGGEATQEECEERSENQLDDLKKFVADFADVNESLFK